MGFYVSNYVLEPKHLKPQDFAYAEMRLARPAGHLKLRHVGEATVVHFIRELDLASRTKLFELLTSFGDSKALSQLKAGACCDRLSARFPSSGAAWSSVFAHLDASHSYTAVAALYGLSRFLNCEVHCGTVLV